MDISGKFCLTAWLQTHEPERIMGRQCLEGPWACLPTFLSLPGSGEPGRTWRGHCWAVQDAEAEGTVPSLSPKGADTEPCHQEWGRRRGNGNRRGLCSRTEKGVWSPRQDALVCPGSSGGQGRPASACPDPPGPILSPDGQGPYPEAPRLEGLGMRVLVGRPAAPGTENDGWGEGGNPSPRGGGAGPTLRGQVVPEGGGTGSPPPSSRGDDPPGGAWWTPAPPSGQQWPPSPPRRTHIRFSPQHPSRLQVDALQPDEERQWTGTHPCVTQGPRPRGPPRLAPGGTTHCLETLLFSRSGGARHPTTWDWSHTLTESGWREAARCHGPPSPQAAFLCSLLQRESPRASPPRSPSSCPRGPVDAASVSPTNPSVPATVLWPRQ